MRAALLLSLCVLTGVSGAGAQVTLPMTPEERVAALIREALVSPDNRGTWAGLAQGLSDLEAAGGQDADGVRAAVRVADSLAFSPDLSVAPGSVEDGNRWSGAESLKATVFGLLSRISGLRLPLRMRSRELLILAGVLLVALAGLSLVRRARASRAIGGGGWAFFQLVRTVSRVARGSDPLGRAHVGRTQDPRVMALSLVETGMPPNEVARRTGMSQDEVSVLLNIHHAKRLAFGVETAVPHRRSA